MLAVKDGVVLEADRGLTESILSCNVHKTVIVTRATERFYGFVDALMGVGSKTFLQFLSPTAEAEPRMRNGMTIEDHSRGVSFWKILSVIGPYGDLIRGPAWVGAGDTMKLEKGIFERPRNFDEAVDQARLLAGRIHYILNSVTLATLGYDGVRGRIDARNSTVYTPVFFDPGGEDLLDFVKSVPGGLDLCDPKTLSYSLVGCRRDVGGLLQPAEESSESLDGIEWLPGVNLLERPDSARIIRDMVFAPRRTIMMLARR